jgi:8-oxo-dGTP pyrophosphatase MutT (NUDIX family)
MWKPHLVVAAVIEREGRFLLVEEEASGRLVLNQPAGHLDPGETLIEAVVREVREETAWGFVPEAWLGVYQLAVDPGLTYVRICFTGQVTDHASTQPLDEGIVAAHWLSEGDIRAAQGRHRSPLVLRCLEDYLGGVRLPLGALQYFRLHP